MTQDNQQYNFLITFKFWSKRFGNLIKQFFIKAYPGEHAFRGAGIGIGALGYLFAIVFAINTILPAGWLYFVVFVILFPIACGLAVSLGYLILNLVLKLPEIFLTALGAGLLMVLIGFARGGLAGVFAAGVLVVLGALVGAGILTLLYKGWHQLHRVQKGVAIAGLVIGSAGLVLSVFWLLSTGQQREIPVWALKKPNLPSLANTISDPSMRGTYQVQHLVYGSGSDKRRSEFGEEVSITTHTIDGSPFVENWTGLRTKIWGFDQTALPLNGRVWYPDKSDPSPLILIVHGNHLAEDYSDDGYAYLCELLASRGSICVSIDQNFINGSAVGDFLGIKGIVDENDLRGWMLLEHLVLWTDLARDPATPFNEKVDLSKIALIGHSRGGEAVAVAASFNRLSHYPDNATVKFDYGFDIQSIVAIAPIDRQYQPASRHIPLQEVSYLTLQGAHDMDVISFDGYNVYERAEIVNDDFNFKSTLYVWGANHGQFNTAWGDNDVGTPAVWLYNRKQLLAGEEQRQIAQVYISAFIDVTLKNEMDYLPLFQNYQTALEWLPETVYFNAYSDTKNEYILTFEEDIDVSTGSIPGVEIVGKGLKTWREDRVSTKWGKMHSNNAVHLGWEESEPNPSYAILVPEGIIEITTSSQFILSAAQLGKNLDDQGIPVPIDFSIVLMDAGGETATLPLSIISPLQPEVNSKLLKMDFLSQGATSELVFQTFIFNLTDFLEENPSFSPSDLIEIRLVFDRTSSGNIVLDNLGFR